MHSYRGRFSSIQEVKAAIKEEFKESVPSDNNFQLGYFLGKSSSKHWLISPEDLPSMYSSLGTKRDVMLWCDGAKHDSLDVGSKRTSPSNNPPSKRRQIKNKVDETVDKLRERHGTKYTLPQMRLWARMVTANHHESLDDPPDIPAITGIVPKRKKPRESVAEAISSLAGALRGTSTGATNTTPADTNTTPADTNTTPVGTNTTPVDTNTTPDSRPSVGYSPGKASELRRGHLQELRELQQLLELNILTPQEFAEQKTIVLAAMHKLVE